MMPTFVNRNWPFDLLNLTTENVITLKFNHSEIDEDDDNIGATYCQDKPHIICAFAPFTDVPSIRCLLHSLAVNLYVSFL